LKNDTGLSEIDIIEVFDDTATACPTLGHRGTQWQILAGNTAVSMQDEKSHCTTQRNFLTRRTVLAGVRTIEGMEYLKVQRLKYLRASIRSVQ
jgi:hypothetical protein